MKKLYFACLLTAAMLSVNAQSKRMCLYEEFTGETCPPCAATNPGLNAILLSPVNEDKVIALKWQVPIPSAPSNSWSLYQTNKAEINWRYSSYGYGVSSAPQGRMDGQNVTVFGATSNHPTYMSNAVIAAAASYTSAFDIEMIRSWDATQSSINLTVNITATAPFNAVGTLMFRTCMVERLINFSVQPGTNGEKKFEDAVIKSFPTTTSGTVVTGMGLSIPTTWTQGQVHTFTMNCPLPSYTRKKDEVALVGFIQDDGNKKIAQAARTSKQSLLANDAEAVAVNASYMTCSGITPVIKVQNHGTNDITSFDITPYIDGVAGTPYTWSGTLANGAFTTVTMTPVNSTVGGGHSLSLKIGNVSGGDADISNNDAVSSFYVGGVSSGTMVTEDFLSTTFPQSAWGIQNFNADKTWERSTTAGAYGGSPESAIYPAFTNGNVGDKDELILPPLDLTGVNAPLLSFDIAYAQRNTNSGDQLQVFASSDCGVTWTKFFDQVGGTLAGGVAPTLVSYVPNAFDWRTETVNLTGFNKNKVLVKFVATNGNGNNIYIDNINLSQTNAVSVKSNGNFEKAVVFPNPANDKAVVRISTLNGGSAVVRVSNMVGQTVIESNTGLNQGTNVIDIPTADLPAGIYNVSVSFGDVTQSTKLSVTH